MGRGLQLTGDQLVRRARLAEAAERYYVMGWSQDRVAAHLGTSRSNISRLLDAARREGVVRFVVDHPLRRHVGLEEAIIERWGLDHVAILATDRRGPLDLVGSLAARRLTDRLADGKRVALGWGTSVEATVHRVEVDRPLRMEIVQIGGDLAMPSSSSGHQLVRELATRLGGEYSFLPAPVLLETPRLARQVLDDPVIRTELDRARSADLAVVGIGIPGRGFAESVIADAYTGGPTPAAVISARLVDENGEEIAGPLRERVVALTLDELRGIPTVVGVAAGIEKARAVVAALNGGLVDELVCDQSLASEALRIVDERSSNGTS